MAKTPNNGALTQACSVLTKTVLGTLIILLQGFRTMKLWHPPAFTCTLQVQRTRREGETVGGSVHTYTPSTYVCIVRLLRSCLFPVSINSFPSPALPVASSVQYNHSFTFETLVMNTFICITTVSSSYALTLTLTLAHHIY